QDNQRSRRTSASLSLCLFALQRSPEYIRPRAVHPTDPLSERKLSTVFSPHVNLRLFLRRLSSSSVSRPFSGTHFLGPLLRANSCVRQLRGLCFLGSSLNNFGSLPECSRSLWKQQPLAFGWPQENGAEKGDSKMSYLNSVTLVGFVGADPEQRQAKGNGS